MGCVPNRDNLKFKSTSELESNNGIINESRPATRLNLSPKVIKSRFISKLQKFKTGLGVIYESNQESEMA